VEVLLRLSPYTEDVIPNSSDRAGGRSGRRGPSSDAEAAGLRVDAERNRERILGAAQELFTEQGLGVPLEDIARRAGVGIATLYRRFPTRPDLIAATFERKIAVYTSTVERSLENPDPWAGFCQLIHDLCAMQAADAGLKELLTLSFPDSTFVEELKAQALVNLTTLIQGAQQQGCLRADFDVSDVLLVLLANAGIVTATRAAAPEAWRRFAAYMIDAFRAEPSDRPLSTRPLPTAPTHEQLERSLAHRTS
jgi:AcrR family transcriptional regulator